MENIPIVDSLDIPDGWLRVADRVLERGRAVAMVVGDRDTGKSTLVRWLADRAVERGLSTWTVDADVGQSDFGPPTTVSARAWGSEGETHLYFVGSTSPRRHLLPCVVGAGRLVAQAREAGAQVVVVNTTGYVADAAAAALKAAKIDLLRPDYVLALERERELRPMVEPFLRMDTPRVVRVPISPAVHPRSAEARERRRAERWAGYLVGARRVDVGIGPAAWSGAGLLDPLVGRAVGLFDADDECRAVGPVVAGDRLAHRYEVLAPLPDGVRVARMHVGEAMVPGFAPEPTGP